MILQPALHVHRPVGHFVCGVRVEKHRLFPRGISSGEILVEVFVREVLIESPDEGIPVLLQGKGRFERLLQELVQIVEIAPFPDFHDLDEVSIVAFTPPVFESVSKNEIDVPDYFLRIEVVQ